MCSSVSSLIRLYEAAGRHWEEIADDALAGIRAAETIPDKASCITVQIDGVMVPVGQDKRKEEEGLGGGARPPARRSHVATPPAALCAPSAMAVCRSGTGCVSSNWRFLETAFPEATPVLGFCHCAEHLKSALDAAYGEGHHRVHRRWAALRETLLIETDGVDRVIASLDYLRRTYAPSVARTITDFRNNRHRIRYADYRARNLMIGSGLVEATNKVLVTRRMKGSGMTWGRVGLS